MKNWGHIPVLLHEVLDVFQDRELKVFVDGTLGAGGHSLAILEAHPEIETHIGFDQDQEALKKAQERLKPYKEKVIFCEQNFCDMNTFCEEKYPQVDGILLDIGVSSMQLDQPERGFSFSKDGPLDMRMDRSCTLTAAEIVNTWSEKELTEIFKEYGEVRRPHFVAQKIVSERKRKKFKTTRDLVDLLSPFLKKSSKKGIHPLTLVFQALRIAVNNELKVLEYSLPKITDLLKPGGRLAVISFHSGEDRIVKNSFKELSTSLSGDKPIAKIITKKPIIAEDGEVHANVRSRSAKMRVLEKL